MVHILSPITELPHDKTNKDSDQPGRPSSSESTQCSQWVAEDPMFLHADVKTLIRLGGSFCWFCHEVDQLITALLESADGGEWLRKYFMIELCGCAWART